ncbi:MAG: hypothetical protein NTX86_05160 [Candidatus Dependentiae bacterium]|nr:hypothetical protein [Candidatus Dependentiae bacterium]
MTHLTSSNDATHDASKFCSYYQAHIRKEECWLLTATLRSFEHIAFDRTIDKSQSIFEFFVPQGMEGQFLELMAYYEKTGLVSNLTKMPNRLIDPTATL